MAEHLDISGYRYAGAGTSHAHGFLLPPVVKILEHLAPADRRLFEVGCGNGAVANVLQERGWDVAGVDPSNEGIAAANRAYPGLRLAQGSAYDDLVAEYGSFPVVLSLEVVEHVYFPREYARTVHDLLAPGGHAIISTPYHGYLKNLALAVTGKMDAHFTALWDNGHIKFWSVQTLTELLREADLRVTEVHRVGRIPPLAKSMIVVARRDR